MAGGNDFLAAIGGWRPASGLEGKGNFHIANNLDKEPLKKKDNPADASSIAARLASGNVTC